jgi:hypothetical protein
MCEQLGIESDDDISGKDVWNCVQNKEYNRVIEHCEADVEKTREAFKRLVKY